MKLNQLQKQLEDIITLTGRDDLEIYVWADHGQDLYSTCSAELRYIRKDELDETCVNPFPYCVEEYRTNREEIEQMREDFEDWIPVVVIS